MSEGLFQTLSNKFKLRYNETIKSLQFHKLSRKPDKNMKNGWADLEYLPENVITKKLIDN